METDNAATVRGRVAIEVLVTTDQVPGWGYDAQDYADHIQQYLDQTIPHYEPEVRVVGKVESSV